jgi:hypothetical protein
MFNLEPAIATWRQQMLAAGLQSPVPLGELELHLREDIEQRLQSGSDEQSAFESAVQKIGGASPLQDEFAKVETASEARKWKFQQLALTASATLFPLWIGCMVFFKIGGFSQLTSGEWISSLAAIAVFSLLFWVGRLCHGIFPVIPSKRIRDAIVSVGFALVALWWIVALRVIVPHYDLTAGQFGMVFLWGFLTPMGAFGGLTWGIEAAARKLNTTSDS